MYVNHSKFRVISDWPESIFRTVRIDIDLLFSILLEKNSWNVPSRPTVLNKSSLMNEPSQNCLFVMDTRSDVKMIISPNWIYLLLESMYRHRYYCSKVIDTCTGLMHQYHYRTKRSPTRHVQNQSQSVEHNVDQRNICAAFHCGDLDRMNNNN